MTGAACVMTGPASWWEGRVAPRAKREHGVGDALARLGVGRAHVGLHLVGGAAAGDRRRQPEDRGTRNDACEDQAAATAARDAIEHVRDLLCYGGRSAAVAARRIGPT